MSAESEMRAVILHAAEKLAKAPDYEATANVTGISQFTYKAPRASTVAIAYAEGVLRLLASYLAVEDKPRVDGTGRERDEHGRFLPAGAQP